MNEQALKNKISELEASLNKLKKDFSEHLHTDTDGTRQLRKSIKLDNDQYFRVGLGSMGTTISDGQIQYGISAGKDDGRIGFVDKADLAQIDILHQTGTVFSFLTGRRTPVVAPKEGTSLSISSGSNTVTIAGYNFTTNELAGAKINIYTSAGALSRTRTIVSNTATVITVDSNWGANLSGATFQIYLPIYLGSADNIWERAYVDEGTAGGVRFGDGVTNGGQNGLLYMDSSGDLYWRDKSGSSLKLNVAPTP